MKAVTITGTAVKRLRKEVLLSRWGINLGVLVFPSISAWIAITEHMPTKITARRTDIAELNLNDSGKTSQPK